MRNALITTDLHFTDAPREAYRFRIFDYLEEQITKLAIHHIFLLGDLTDKTDRHSARLVNELVPRIQRLAEKCQIFILRGNHDYVDPTCPYFMFLNQVNNVHYVITPTRIKLDGTKIYLLPHTRHPELDWKGLEINKADMVFMHQTLRGAKAENGQSLEGDDGSILAGCPIVYSGDVHVPQQMHNLIYVGSPYHIHFGDSFIPRVLFLPEEGESMELFPKFPSRLMLNLLSVTDLETRDFKKGDQCKLNIVVSSEQWPNWPKIRQEFMEKCNELGLELYGIEPTAMWRETKHSSDSNFMLGAASSKEYIKQFLTVKYPGLGDPYMNSALAIIREVDGIA